STAAGARTVFASRRCGAGVRLRCFTTAGARGGVAARLTRIVTAGHRSRLRPRRCWFRRTRLAACARLTRRPAAARRARRARRTTLAGCPVPPPVAPLGPGVVGTVGVVPTGPGVVVMVLVVSVPVDVAEGFEGLGDWGPSELQAATKRLRQEAQKGEAEGRCIRMGTHATSGNEEFRVSAAT